MIFHLPSWHSALHSIYFRAKLSQKKVEIAFTNNPKADEIRRRLQPTSDGRLSTQTCMISRHRLFNSYFLFFSCFEATVFLRWHERKIFPFNLAGSLPQGIPAPPAHINQAKLHQTRGGGGDSDADKMAASVHLQANRSGSV